MYVDYSDTVYVSYVYIIMDYIMVQSPVQLIFFSLLFIFANFDCEYNMIPVINFTYIDNLKINMICFI